PRPPVCTAWDFSLAWAACAHQILQLLPRDGPRQIADVNSVVRPPSYRALWSRLTVWLGLLLSRGSAGVPHFPASTSSIDPFLRLCCDHLVQGHPKKRICIHRVERREREPR
ncbi:unnamed protein product, partial [Ectocarpus fasciculatus]